MFISPFVKHAGTFYSKVWSLFGEKALRPESISFYLEDRSTNPIGCLLPLSGPAFFLLVPVPQPFRLLSSKTLQSSQAQGACPEARETSDSQFSILDF